MNARSVGALSAVACLLLGSPAVAAEPVKKTVRAGDGLSLVCEVRGRGDVALVFLHGWCGDREYWKHQVDVFAADYTVVALDQAGHGESGRDRTSWTVDALAGEVAAVVKDLGLKRVVLVGHSMGGSVALLAAKRLPGTVVGVVGVDTLQDADARRPREMVESVFAGLDKDFRGAVGGMLTGLLPEAVDPGLKAWLGAKAAGRDPAAVVPLFRDLFVLDLAKALREAGVPVRCVNSAGGFPFFAPTAVAVNKKYADFDAVTIADVGHYPMLEKPAEFNAKLRAVLADLAATK